MPYFEFWGDGSGGAQALTTSFASGGGASAGVQRIADPADLVCRADIAGADATRIEFRVQMRPVGGSATDWVTIPMSLGQTTYVTYAEGIAAIDGTIATDVPVFFHVPGECDIRVQARRVGGTASTTLFLEGLRRYNRDSPAMASGFLASSGESSSGVPSNGFDAEADAYRSVVLNGKQTDRDKAAQTLADETDETAAAHYYPDSSGIEVGDRTWLNWFVSMRDGVLTFEVSHDRTTWLDCTAQTLDNTTGTTGAANYTEGDVALTNYGIEWPGCPYPFLRLVFTPPNATNSFKATLIRRVL